MGKGVTRSDPQSRVEDEHVLEEIDCWEWSVRSVMRGGTVSPSGSAFLNLLVKGCRSRLGRDWTKRKVCSYQSAPSLHPRSSASPYILATNGLDNVVWRCSQ